MGGLLTLTVLGVLAEFLPVQYSVEGREASSSISFIPMFVIGLSFHPTTTVLATALIIGTASTLGHKLPAWKTIFNVCQVALAVRLGSELYYYLSTSTLPILHYDVVALAGLSLTFFITNTVLVSFFYSIDQSTPFLPTLKRIAGPGGSNLYYDLLVSPLALLVSYVYRSSGLSGVLLLVLPLYILRHSYVAMLQLQQANRALLKVLIKAIDTRDPYTSGHSLRVSLLARAIAEDMGVRGRRLDDVETAALLHDIGKVDGIYAELIRKPHALSADEVKVIRTHATKGADFVGGLRTYSDGIVLSIRHHHEKYDGSGYPNGLRGSEIPLAARIIQISDSIDAMLSDRPYRSALSLEQVHTELRRCAGSQFDPGIVDNMLERGSLTRMLPTLRLHGGKTAAVLPRIEASAAV